MSRMVEDTSLLGEGKFVPCFEYRDIYHSLTVENGMIFSHTAHLRLRMMILVS